jgi:hypothetical protein
MSADVWVVVRRVLGSDRGGMFAALLTFACLAGCWFALPWLLSKHAKPAPDA